MLASPLATLLLTAGGMAVAAQVGLVKEVEVEYEGQQWLCEVKLVDETGKRYKLHVDVATNRVVKIK